MYMNINICKELLNKLIDVKSIIKKEMKSIIFNLVAVGLNLQYINNSTEASNTNLLKIISARGGASKK